MKCMVAAVILALAVVSEAGLLPYGGWPYGHLGAPTVIQSNVLAHPYGAISHSAIHAALPAYAPHAALWAAPHHAAILAAPHHGPAASVAHHAGVVPGATSVTATRGAVHVAPLPGHAVSQQQLNLAPAPGTI
ncbi:adult cuticle protein 1-like [Anopheles aquasalis]|uniref:adult cuticle protein 1-like n=1 Tax=Anopheles aquasalis TaxID=42839 RepID=UPI00215A2BE6|nr:adult cuticle protein 1-like [Anopheles aquasalis]